MADKQGNDKLQLAFQEFTVRVYQARSASDELLLFTASSEGSDRKTSSNGLHWIPVSWFTDNLQTCRIILLTYLK